MLMSRSGDDSRLTRVERVALSLFRFLNEDPRAKEATMAMHRQFGRRWVGQSIKNLLHVEGIDKAVKLRPEKGVLLCSNHRSFFDQYVLSCVLIDKAPWMERIYFPVRSNFFYETLSGMLVNLVIGGGAMYPPIFRDASRADLNKQALQKAIELLQRPGNMVGVHPEGTRGKGPDPYQLLPAQPGAGQIALLAKTTILPCFINGLSNDFFGQILSNFRTGERRGEPIIVVFGDPVDLGELAEGRPRPAQYKRVSDRIVEAIRSLGEQERHIRAQILHRKVG
jgi:1-acyl-sn-glycerol-3-phosphate acyltransferase